MNGVSTIMIHITISYATPEKQIEIPLSIPDSCTIQSAIAQSNITALFPDIKIENNLVGIFGKRATMETIVNDGDRVEIYRPLVIDPKLARRQRSTT